MTTGTIILAIIALIFGIDAYRDYRYGSNATISAWFYKWLGRSWVARLIYFSAFALLTVHFIFFH